jgi:hypothetical protein
MRHRRPQREYDEGDPLIFVMTLCHRFPLLGVIVSGLCFVIGAVYYWGFPSSLFGVGFVAGMVLLVMGGCIGVVTALGYVRGKIRSHNSPDDTAPHRTNLPKPPGHRPR